MSKNEEVLSGFYTHPLSNKAFLKSVYFPLIMNTLAPSTPIDFFQVSMSLHFYFFYYSSDEDDSDSFFFFTYFLFHFIALSWAELLKLNFSLYLYFPLRFASLSNLAHG